MPEPLRKSIGAEAAIEIGTEPDPIAPRDLRDCLDVAHAVGKRRVATAREEVPVEIQADRAVAFGDRSDLLAGQVTLVAAVLEKPPRVGMGRDDPAIRAGEQVVERGVGEMRHVVEDAEFIRRGDEVASLRREPRMDLVAARGTGAHRPRETKHPDAAFEPPREFLAASDAVGAFDEDDHAKPRVARLVEILPPTHETDPPGFLEGLVAGELAASGVGGGDAIVPVAIAPRMRPMVQSRFDEDRPEAEIHRGLGEIRQAAAVPLVGTDAGFEVSTEFREVGEVEMGVDPPRGGGAIRVGWGDRHARSGPVRGGAAGFGDTIASWPLVARLCPRTYPDAMPSAAMTSAATRTAPLAAGERLVAAGIASLAASPLAVAAWLEPSGSGVGTHQQLGLPACGWIAGLGMPCPSCGMTTAFAFAARGSLVEAFATQPAGALLALAAAIVALVAAWTSLTASRSWELLWSAMGRRFWWGFAAVAALAWVYKIAAMRIDSMALPLAAGGGGG